MGSAIGKTVAPLAIGYTIYYVGPACVTYACAGLAVAMVLTYTFLHYYIMRRETVSTPHFAPVAGRPFNTYQRAQSILYDNRKVGGGYGKVRSKPSAHQRSYQNHA